MAIFRLKDNVPDTYVKQSRDFQLLCNVFDYMNNGVKFDIDSIRDITDTDLCNERLLALLQTRIGFYSEKSIDSDSLRKILKAFPYIVRYKGSVTGIYRAIVTFMKVQHIKGTPKIEITTTTDDDKFTITISLNTQKIDTTILEEILKYIVPAGFDIKYKFSSDEV